MEDVPEMARLPSPRDAEQSVRHHAPMHNSAEASCSEIRCAMHSTPALVIDSNVFVAALFRPESHAARLIEGVRQGHVRHVWNRETRRETRAILETIPPIAWSSVADLFESEGEFTGHTDRQRFSMIPDPDDRKFAALAYAAGAVLISQDGDLLSQPERLDILVLTPREFAEGIWR